MRSGFLGGGVGPRAIRRASGLADPVPVLGAELIVNGGFNVASYWGIDSNWIIADGVLQVNAAGVAYATQGVIGGSLNDWLMGSFDLVFRSAGSINLYLGGTAGVPRVELGLQISTSRPSNVASPVALFEAGGSPVAWLDNVSVRRIDTASLFSTRTYASADCDLSVAITRTTGTQAGLVARLDSATSPANFVIAYLHGAGSVKVDKCVAGTYTNVISGAVTYAAGRTLRLVCSGNSVSCYYNGAQVGSTVTVSDAGIVSNTRHGKFSTYAANTFTGYTAA